MEVGCLAVCKIAELRRFVFVYANEFQTSHKVLPTQTEVFV